MNRPPLNRPIKTAIAVTLVAALALAGTAVAQQSSEGTDGDEGQATLATASASAFDSATSTGRAPDENVPASEKAGPRATSQTFSYYLVTGATLRGRSSTTAYSYSSQGCTYLTAGAGTNLILNTELHIPDGSVIKYLRVIYDDTSATGSVRGYLTRYTPGQLTSDLVSAASTAAFDGGFGYTVSSEITETVDNGTYAYTLIGWPTDPAATLQVCGLRIAYYAPTGSTAYMPTMARTP